MTKSIVRRSAVAAARVAGLCLVALALGGVAQAGPPDVPELDPGSAVGAVTLLGGGLAMLTGRCRSKSSTTS